MNRSILLVVLMYVTAAACQIPPADLNLPCGRKVVTMAGGADGYRSVYLLTRPLHDDDVLETYEFSPLTRQFVQRTQRITETRCPAIAIR